MTIFIISDTHFGHENMYKFTTHVGGPRVRAKFANAKEADEWMLDVWNMMVTPQDHVYHLGDVAMNLTALQLVKKLNGHKRLVLGNHDFPDMKKYIEVGFQKIYGVKLPLMDLVLSHVPLHPDHLPRWSIGNVHGHIHERPSPKGKYFNASVEQINYTPIAIEEVIACLTKSS